MAIEKLIAYHDQSRSGPRRSRPAVDHSPGSEVLANVGIAAGLLGAASALALLLVPPMVSADRYSYPFTASWYVTVQLFFAAQHLMMVAGVVGLRRVLVSTPSRLARVGTGVGLIGLLLLSACELLALVAIDAPTVGPQADLVNAAYGLPTLVTGAGFVLAGTAVARFRVGPRWARWVVLLFGGWVFVVLLPALVGSDAAGRLAIGGWMLIFVAVCVAVRRVDSWTLT